jgi:hypothetical protein
MQGIRRSSSRIKHTVCLVEAVNGDRHPVRVASRPVETLRQKTNHCQEIDLGLCSKQHTADQLSAPKRSCSEHIGRKGNSRGTQAGMPVIQLP